MTFIAQQITIMPKAKISNNKKINQMNPNMIPV